MISRRQINADRKVCERIAKSVAPYKTGNLRWNAISSFNTTDGFAIAYSLQDAFYIFFLEEGTKFSKRHIGFIGDKTVNAIKNYYSVKYGSKDIKGVRKYQRSIRNENLGMYDFLSDTSNADERNLESLNYWHSKEIQNKYDWYGYSELHSGYYGDIFIGSNR